MERVRKQADPETTPFYGFSSDGSTAKTEHMVHRITDNAVRSLVQRRQAGRETPKSCADQIEVLGASQAFRNLEQWRTLADPLDWPTAQTATSAEEAVKRCGRGPGSKTRKLGWYGSEWREARTGEVVRLPQEIEQEVADF